MKQRLALALALQGDPPVLVMDEPTSNLDAAARDQLLHLLAEVKAPARPSSSPRTASRRWRRWPTACW